MLFFCGKLRFFLKNFIFALEFANSIFKMLDKTLGIVLGTVPYNDNTQFVHIYTERFGKVTYKTSTPKAHSKKAQQRKLAFQPMTLLELNVQHSDSKELQQIQDAEIVLSPLSYASNDPIKFSQCLYIAELLDKSIREIECNQMLWDYLYHSVEIFSITDVDTSNFHLLFTAKLWIPLGFGIDESIYKPGMLFDLNEGKFTSEKIEHAYYLNSISAEYLYKLLQSDFTNISELSLNSKERNIMLDILITYHKLHIPEIGTLNSTDILKDMF